jgi:hypothetical protein
MHVTLNNSRGSIAGWTDRNIISRRSEEKNFVFRQRHHRRAGHVVEHVKGESLRP